MGSRASGNAHSARVSGILAVVFLAGFVLMALKSDSWYATAKAAHVVAAIVWVGGAFMIQLFAVRILATKDDRRIGEFSGDIEYIGMRTFIPASLVLLILGFYMVHDAHWGYPFWIWIAIVVWALSFISGAFYLGPESGRVSKLIKERGGVDDEIRGRIEKLLLHSRAEMVLIALLAIDMVLKPTF